MTDELFSTEHDAEEDSGDERSEFLDLVRLSRVNGIGPRMLSLLIARFGDATSVLDAPTRDLKSVPGCGPKLVAAIASAENRREIVAELESCESRGIHVLASECDDYPKSLARTDDHPPLLYCRGNLLPADEMGMAIVGSRRCTIYGTRVAERLARGLTHAGLTIVSGLARGIDAAAHEAALEAGGRTIGVLATGVDRIYPPEHTDLAHRVSHQGAIVSESRRDQVAKPGLFPQRNRIISGLSLGVIIVEASRKSGALHTARHAMEQGREVFAVPGPIDSPASEGCHDLIRDGAVLVRDVDDILETLGPLAEPVRTADDEVVHVPRELNLSEQERTVLNLIGTQPTPINTVLSRAGIESSRVLSTLTVLEMKRLVQRLPGNHISRRT